MMKQKSLLAFALLVIACQCFADKKLSIEHDDYGFPEYRDRVLEKSYHGLIKENETFVEITPVIKVDGDRVCNLKIIKSHKDIPFKIKLYNSVGVLEAKRTLNCEKRKNYKFEIYAVLCNGNKSESAAVHISVVDINEYSPVFLQPSYVTEVDEGRLYQEIIRVEATDKDCTPLFGDVCRYEILTADQPFIIDNEGSIKNVMPLSHKASHNHILSVIAYDCAMKQSAPVMVTIRVRKICEAKIMGIQERLDYSANTLEKVFLFPKFNLELCDIKCKGEEMLISTKVTLKTKHISFGCDRDGSKCEAKNSMIELLNKNAEWTKDNSFDEGDENIFHFDGSNGMVIPDTVINLDKLATRRFTIQTMFRHHSIFNNDKITKEHVLCSADSSKMNRHHFALFVRHCRLILLLRQNNNDGNLNIFLPAEWRWKIPEVCDNEWHQYLITVDLPKVELFIDGVRFVASQDNRHSNPEIIDDWPLHAASGINTTLTVGACYQSSENRLKHGFRGDISSIKLNVNEVLRENEIKCGIDCAERLLQPDEKLMETDQQVQINSQMNEITIEGTSKENIEKLVQQIQYINEKINPTIGRRNLAIETTSITIAVYSGNDINEDLQKLDSCNINVFPSLNADHEEITLSHIDKSQVSPDVDIKTVITKNGVEMIGSDTIHNYLHILHNLVYKNSFGLYYLNRIFKISCSQLGNQIKSGELTITLTVLHPKSSTLADTQTTSTEKTSAAILHQSNDNVNLFNHVLLNPQEVNEPHVKTSHNYKLKESNSTMLIVVICASFIILICGVGVARLKSQTQTLSGKNKQQPSKSLTDQHQQLDWDDSDLTISLTINPFQNENATDDSSDSENSESDEEEGKTTNMY
ncbi:CLUMA_CG004569, isoform A [Clunio marinus]|uniref:CLUMA_CG004569, isoform A n=1 Tax=Clunio marinus TaxID=568069 RepID=A0A1J1HS48_9DIPT|nr:CLUMA_CG004569, isoform A [Clunio marinus]